MIAQFFMRLISYGIFIIFGAMASTHLSTKVQFGNFLLDKIRYYENVLGFFSDVLAKFFSIFLNINFSLPLR